MASRKMLLRQLSILRQSHLSVLSLSAKSSTSSSTLKPVLRKCHLSVSTKHKPSLLCHHSTLMNKERKHLNNSSLSQAAGHVSFVMAISAFAATDILDLRCLAIGATSLSMVFQYYRPIPLSIPLKWNTLVLGINLFMAY